MTTPAGAPTTPADPTAQENAMSSTAADPERESPGRNDPSAGVQKALLGIGWT
ncbi:hypothetical protein HLB09_03875, partial [Pseudokineococcus marinus]|nr:hypothetical protein [Pseudokineococcus marinus]